MKKIIAFLLAVLMMGTVPVCVLAAESDEGQLVSGTFYEMTYSVPETWRVDLEDEATVDYIPYANAINGGVMFSAEEIDLSKGNKWEWMDDLISVLYEEDSADIDDVSEVENVEVDGVSGLKVCYTQEWNEDRADGGMYVFATDTRRYAISWVVIPSRSAELKATMESIVENIDFSALGDTTPEGFVEDSFCELNYVVPETWDLRNEYYDEDDETEYVRYYQSIEDGLLGPLDIEAKDALATLRDLALAQILLFGEVDSTAGITSKLDFLAKIDLQSREILEKDLCKIGGVNALRVKTVVGSGIETVHYYFITDEYYYHFYFWPDGQESADGFEEIIWQIIDSIQIATK